MSPEEIQNEIRAQVAAVKKSIADQKRVIKRSEGKTVVVSAAEQELRQLRTRLGVLEGNLSRLQGDDKGAECDTAIPSPTA